MRTKPLAAYRVYVWLEPLAKKMNVVSFVVDNLSCFDVGQFMDARGIALRTGHHCTQPLMQRFGLENTVRASLAMYNTRNEINTLAENLSRYVTRRAKGK